VPGRPRRSTVTWLTGSLFMKVGAEPVCANSQPPSPWAYPGRAAGRQPGLAPRCHSPATARSGSSCPGRIVNDCPPSDTRISPSPCPAGPPQPGHPGRGPRSSTPPGPTARLGRAASPPAAPSPAGGRGQPGGGLNVKPVAPAWPALRACPGETHALARLMSSISKSHQDPRCIKIAPGNVRLLLGVQGQRDGVDAPALVGGRRVAFAGEDMAEVGVARRAPRLDPDRAE